MGGLSEFTKALVFFTWQARIGRTLLSAATLPAIALLCFSSVAIPTHVEAAIFKCVDANGDISYNQLPCAGTAQTAKVLATSSSKQNVAQCRIANNFAYQTATSMRSGKSSAELFDSYGGIDALPPTSVGVINYVYSHKDNVNTGAQRITALSAARCSAGSYGPVSCDDFPYQFIAALGGCEKAAMSPMSTGVATGTEPASSNDATNMQALGVRTDIGSNSASDLCKKNVEAQLSDLFAQMRSGQSANGQEQLQAQRDQLRDQLSSC